HIQYLLNNIRLKIYFFKNEIFIVRFFFFRSDENRFYTIIINRKISRNFKFSIHHNANRVFPENLSHTELRIVVYNRVSTYKKSLLLVHPLFTLSTINLST